MGYGSGITRYLQGSLVQTVAAAAVSVVMISACGGGGAGGASNARTSNSANLTAAEKVYQKYNAMTGKARETALLAQAKKEGSVSVYGSPNVYQPISDAFTKKYGIKVDFYGAQSTEMEARVHQEQAAGKYSVDVIAETFTYLESDDRQGYFANYQSSFRNQVPSAAKGKDWTASRVQPIVVAYNTKLVTQSDLPTSYADLADPKWKDKIAVGDSYDYWYYGLVTYLESTGKSQAEATNIMLGIARNARVVDGSTNEISDLASGEFAFALDVKSSDVDELAKKGAPVTWGDSGVDRKIAPVLMTYSGAGMFKHAPHPAAAMLFMDFLFSSDADTVYLANSAYPELGKSPLSTQLRGAKTWPVDVSKLVTNQNTWDAAYSTFLRQTGGS